RIDHHGHSNGLGHQLMQEPQPLGCDLLGEIVDAGGVAARPGKAGDKTKLNRVFADAEDNRDRRSRSFGCLCSKVAGRRGDNGDAPAHEVSHERWQTIELALQPMVLDRYVLILNETGFAEAFAERGSTTRRGIGCPGVYEADHWQGRLLRLRHERPADYTAAYKYDEFPPPHGAYPKAKDHGTKYSRCWGGSVARITIKRSPYDHDNAIRQAGRL